MSTFFIRFEFISTTLKYVYIHGGGLVLGRRINRHTFSLKNNLISFISP
jgi:hypothetical protein